MLLDDMQQQAKKSSAPNLTSTRRKSRLDGLHRAPIHVPENLKEKEEIKASAEDGVPKGRLSKKD
jgi:hypothetical protein